TRSLFLTWAIMGLWHGAAWTFVLWGLLHAIWIFAYRNGRQVVKHWSYPIRHVAGWLITLPVVMLSWIPFRAESLEQTWTLYSHLFQPSRYLWLGMRENNYLVTALVLLGFLLSYGVSHHIWPYLTQRSWPIIPKILETIMLAVIMGLVFIFLRPISQFIYFQF
ncbi:MBOAT family protein, partial [Magnetococcus sp. PR-3]